MRLFIRLVDGKPFEHPIVESNFDEVFPHVDKENLPAEFANFERVDFPFVDVYDVYEGTTYEKFGDVYKDVHHVRAMTDEEKALKIAFVKTQEHPEGWVFSEELCQWIDPVTDLSVSGSAPDVIA